MEEAMRKRSPRVLWIVAVIAAVLVALLVAGWWLRDPIASFVATRVMESQGLSCTRVLVQVPSSMPPSPIQLAPMRCESAEGPLQSIEFHSPLYVDLDGLGIGLVHSESVTIAHRAQAHRDVQLNTLGDITRIAGFDEPAIEMLFDAAQMSARKVPPFFVTQAKVLRAGRLVATLRDMRVTPMPTGMSISSPDVRVAQAVALGDASLTMTASPDRVIVDVHFQSNLRAKVAAEHMQAVRPSVRFEIGVGENSSRAR
jgi:hypothetical protein